MESNKQNQDKSKVEVEEKEKLEIYVGDHTEHYTREELDELGILYD